jgi:sec-independent protein translocase protein TatA
MFGLGFGELAVILVIIVILFGVGKLPQVGTGLGEGIRNFKKAYRDANTIDVSSGADVPGKAEKKAQDQSSDKS